jgi:hypothetical protein
MLVESNMQRNNIARTATTSTAKKSIANQTLGLYARRALDGFTWIAKEEIKKNKTKINRIL